MTAPLGPDEQLERFEAWLSDEFEITAAVSREGNKWFALLLDFDVTGTGDTRSDAVTDAFDLLSEYLHSYFVDGASFEDAVRPVPFRLRVRIAVESALARMARRIDGRLLSRLSIIDETTYALPAGLLARFAV